MKDTAEPPSTSQVHAALLDYFSAPGKYQLTLRQPAVLFSAIRDVLQLAAGRGAPADAKASRAADLREAADFFLRAALLYPGADHYAVLGLPPRTEPVELKERYRLLMRLIHPDYATAGAAAWPADAAVRVNRAYEVLSSPVLRREYDEQLAGRRTQRPPEKPAKSDSRAVVAIRRPQRRTFHFDGRTAWVLGLVAAVAVLWALAPGSDPAQLVQRHAPPPTPEAPAQAPQAEPEPLAAMPAAPAKAPVTKVAQPAPMSVPVPAPPPVAAAPPPARPAPAAAPAPAPLNPANEPGAPATAFLLRPEAASTASPPAVLATLPIPTHAAASVPAGAATVSRASMTAAAPGPTLGEVQPLLTQLLQTLETGSGEQVLRMLDADARQAPSAQLLSREYEQIARRGRPVRLSHVDFKGEPRNGVLLVTGRIRLHAGEPTIGSHGEKLLLRAEFASRGGKVALTGLSGGVD